MWPMQCIQSSQVLDVASSSLNAANCSAAPDCRSLNRADCGSDGLREDNTCGECSSGTVGVLGADNSQCIDTTAVDDSCSNEVMVREKKIVERKFLSKQNSCREKKILSREEILVKRKFRSKEFSPSMA